MVWIVAATANVTPALSVANVSMTTNAEGLAIIAIAVNAAAAVAAADNVPASLVANAGTTTTALPFDGASTAPLPAAYTKPMTTYINFDWSRSAQKHNGLFRGFL